jgi:hypothetical protein
MAKSGKKKKSAPIVKVRLRGCPDEQSFIEHVLDRFTIGGLRLRTKADPDIGSKLRVVYQLEDGETVFHALCLVAGTSPPRDGKRTLDLRFRRMSRSSKDIYDAILEAQKLRVRGEEAASGEDQGREDQPTPHDVSAVSSEEPDDGADSGRGQLPTPVSGVRAFPDEEESAEEAEEQAAEDATPVEGIDQQAEPGGSVEDEEPAKKRRLSSDLTTEEVLQLEDDEILDVDEDEQDGEESTATAEVVAEADESEADEPQEEGSAEGEDLATAEVVDEDTATTPEPSDSEEEAVSAKSQDDTEETDEVPTADIVAEDEEEQEPAAEIVAESAEDEEADDDEAAAAVAEEETPTAEIVEEDEEEEMMEAEVFDDEDLLAAEELDDDLEQSFDEMFDDLGDMLFSEDDEEEDVHHAPTEETDTVYSQAAPPSPPTAESGKEEDDEAYDILKDAFEFASSDSTPEPEKPRDGSRLRLASASYQAVPQEDDEEDAGEDEAPDVVEEENIRSRPSDAYDIVKDAFEFASSDSAPPESKERDASTLRLASAAYQAVPDDAVDDEGDEEDNRTSEEQEREALEALARQKERSGPRPIVGPAVRKKKKGFFERLFNNDE